MRTSLKVGCVVAFIGCILASTTVSSFADTNDVSGVVSAGNLTATTSAITMTATTLDGQNVQHAIGTPATVWRITDARGSSAPWTLSVSGTDFVSAAGTRDVTPRTIAVRHLSITPGIVSADSGSDPAATGTSVTLSGTPQSLISVASAGKGSYSYTPVFDLSVPANAFRSNYADAVGIGGTRNPYVATLTYTVA
jgi:hypothetical protein